MLSAAFDSPAKPTPIQEMLLAEATHSSRGEYRGGLDCHVLTVIAHEYIFQCLLPFYSTCERLLTCSLDPAPTCSLGELSAYLRQPAANLASGSCQRVSSSRPMQYIQSDQIMASGLVGFTRLEMLPNLLSSSKGILPEREISRTHMKSRASSRREI